VDGTDPTVHRVNHVAHDALQRESSGSNNSSIERLSDFLHPPADKTRETLEQLFETVAGEGYRS
jgi:hypothetical protein